MVSKKKTYSYEDIVEYRHKIHNSITTYNKIGVIRSLCGVGSIAIGIITTPIPMTTIPLITLGGVLLGYDMRVLLAKVYYKIKLLSNWFYANRNLKLLHRTIKSRVLLWN